MLNVVIIELYFVFSRLGSEDPVIFTGDLRSPSRILDWLSNRKSPSGVNIVEVAGDEDPGEGDIQC